MRENFLITIKGTMEQRGDSDNCRTDDPRLLVHKEGAYYIVYKETRSHRLRRMHHHRQGGRRCP